MRANHSLKQLVEAVMLTLTVGNQKGGVGKSTFSVHLAFRAAERGYRVLLADIDEGDISEVFAEIEEGDNTEYLKASHLFTGEIDGRRPRQVHERIALIEADVDVLDVDDMPLEVISQPRASLGQLAASHAVVSPFNISPFSFARMPKLQATIAGVKSEYNPDLRHLGFLPNMVNSKSVNEIEALPELREAYGELIFDEAIIARACVATALAQGRAVWHHARSGNQRAAAKEMRQACDAVLARLGLN